MRFGISQVRTYLQWQNIELYSAVSGGTTEIGEYDRVGHNEGEILNNREDAIDCVQDWLNTLHHTL